MVKIEIGFNVNPQAFIHGKFFPLDSFIQKTLIVDCGGKCEHNDKNYHQ